MGFSLSKGFSAGGSNPMAYTTPGYTKTGEGSDSLDILGLGLDAKRDIGGFLGMEGLQQMQDALRRGEGRIGRSIRGINRAYGAAGDYMQPFMRGTTIEGYGDIMGDIAGSDIYSTLVDERGDIVANKLGGTGVTRSGYGTEQIAQVPTDVMMGLEQLFSNRQLQGGQIMGGLETERAVNVADLLSNLTAMDIGATQAGTQSRMQGLGNVGNMAGSIIGGVLCDERLKTNKKKVADMPMKDGNVIEIHSYDANEEGERVGMNSRFGPMAQAVKKLYPDLVSTHESGYYVVDMDGLLERAA